MVLFVNGCRVQGNLPHCSDIIEMRRQNAIDQTISCNAGFVFGVHLFSLSGVVESLRPKQ